jgi:hypothetical protein
MSEYETNPTLDLVRSIVGHTAITAAISVYPHADSESLCMFAATLLREAAAELDKQAEYGRKVAASAKPKAGRRKAKAAA